MQQITITELIHADRAKVWEYYTDPTHMIHWNFASDDWICPRAQNDVRVGGILNARMEAKDGSAGFDFEATYTEVIPEQKLAYVMGDQRNASVAFEAVDANNTQVTIVFDAEEINPIEMQCAGWHAILTNFKKYVESR